MNRASKEELEQARDDWAGIEHAQSFVVPSYQFMLARLEAADSRLHTLVAFVATVTLAVPAMSRALHDNISFASWWFLAAMLAAVSAIVVGCVARLHGSLKLPDPMTMYMEWAHLPQWHFQRRALFFAGKHFNANKELIESKAQGVMTMSMLFLLELGCLFVWIVRA